jgi:hypothetical protein
VRHALARTTGASLRWVTFFEPVGVWIGHTWPAIGPLVGVIVGSALSWFGAAQQARTANDGALALSRQDYEHLLQRARTENRDRVYVELEEQRFKLARVLESTVQTRMPSGAIAPLLSLPVDLTPLYDASEEFAAVGRKGSLYFSDSANDALRDVNKKMVSVKAIAGDYAGSISGVERTKVKEAVGATFIELAALRTVMRSEVQGPATEG